MTNATSFHQEEHYTETWEARKARRDKEKDARREQEIVPRRGGRPMAVPVGSDKEMQLRRMWRDGTQIKRIAVELEISEKAVKDASARLRLPTRRPGIIAGVDIHVRVSSTMHRKLNRRAMEKGSTLAKLIRNALAREVEGI